MSKYSFAFKRQNDKTDTEFNWTDIPKRAKVLPCVAKFTARSVVSTLLKFSPVYNQSGSKPWVQKREDAIRPNNHQPPPEKQLKQGTWS